MAKALQACQSMEEYYDQIVICFTLNISSVKLIITKYQHTTTTRGTTRNFKLNFNHTGGPARAIKIGAQKTKPRPEPHQGVGTRRPAPLHFQDVCYVYPVYPHGPCAHHPEAAMQLDHLVGLYMLHSVPHHAAALRQCQTADTCTGSAGLVLSPCV
jgi:hypothetical protein